MGWGLGALGLPAWAVFTLSVKFLSLHVSPLSTYRMGILLVWSSFDRGTTRLNVIVAVGWDVVNEASGCDGLSWLTDSAEPPLPKTHRRRSTPKCGCNAVHLLL